MKRILLLSLAVAITILTTEVAQAADAPLTSTSVAGAAPFPGRKSQWQGFDRYDFPVAGNQAIVVVPRQPLPGHS